MRSIPRSMSSLAAAAAATLLVLGGGTPPVPLAAAPAAPGQVDQAVRRLATAEPDSRIPVLVERTAGTGDLEAFTRHGATVREQIDFHNLVAADVPADQLDALAAESGVVRISADAPMQSQAATDTDPLASNNLQTIYPRIVRAAELWSAPSPIQGTGVGVAVLDSGIKGVDDFKGTNGTGGAPGANRLLARVISIPGQASPNDDNGHGTWVAGIIGGRGWGASGPADDGSYVGIAPNVNLIGVKVSDATGQARVSNVIAGLQWVVNNKDKYNIRVVNLSLVSSVAESYRTSELDAAVEMAWLKGVVVVVAAGNTGPNTMLYAPANDPYVITVGAADDQGTLGTSDDGLAPFSAYGTTADGFAKPELVAPGRRIVSTLYATTSPLAQQFPDRITSNGLYIRLSGTSASAPIVSGVVADLLQARPSLTPDQVKWLLLHTAQPVPGAGTGAGYPQAAAAVAYGGAIGQANVGLVPNNRIAAAGCATLPGCSATTDWNSVTWNSVTWNSVTWNSVTWNSVTWNVTRELSPTD